VVANTADGAGRLLRLILTPGQAGDAPQFPALLSGLRPKHVLADAAYDSAANHELIQASGARACIKTHGNRNSGRTYSKQRYKHRNLIERFFGRIKRCRRVATRYEKKAANYAAFVWLAAGITA
jgi:transposase